MRVNSLVKCVVLAAAAALLAGVPGASAKVNKRPADACISHHKIVAVGTLCSYSCSANGLGCSQRICEGGQWIAALPCPRLLCSQKCG